MTEKKPYAKIGTVICEHDSPNVMNFSFVVEGDVEDLVGKLLAKEPADRIQQARGVEEVLKKTLNEISGEPIVFGWSAFSNLLHAFKKPAYLIPLIIILSCIVYFSVQGVKIYQKGKWAREVALPEIERLIEEDNYQEASLTNVAKYPMARPLHIYTNGVPESDNVIYDYLQYILGEDGQDIVPMVGYVRLNLVNENLIADQLARFS